jgi:hypothetical protein
MVICVVACGAPAGMNPIEGGPVDAGKGSLTAARTYLEGRWALESFEVFPADGPPVTLRGEGTLTYDQFGNLRMEIRADEKSSDVLRAAGVEILDNRISTDGRTVIDLQNRTLAYIAEGQGFATSRSGPLALNRPRHWEVTADTLTLTTKDDSGRPMSVGRWRRMQ